MDSDGWQLCEGEREIYIYIYVYTHICTHICPWLLQYENGFMTCMIWGATVLGNFHVKVDWWWLTGDCWWSVVWVWYIENHWKSWLQHSMCGNPSAPVAGGTTGEKHARPQKTRQNKKGPAEAKHWRKNVRQAKSQATREQGYTTHQRCVPSSRTSKRSQQLRVQYRVGTR